jgi:large subunit ribosomal protein L30
MAKVKLKQIKSVIDRSKRQKDTMYALGLRRMNQVVEKELSPQVEGMIRRVAHLIAIEKG